MAHRGAPALRPEHTLAAYARAIADGADHIEPDLVPTRDGVLVAGHKSQITDTTDIATCPEYATRLRTQTIDGVTRTDWFTTDFTLTELRLLRAHERLPAIRPANTRHDGHFDIPTFQGIIDFVAAEAATCGRVIGLIPEIKNATHLRLLGFTPEETFLHIIAAHEYTRYYPLEVQSFETTPLRRRVQAINPQAGASHAAHGGTGGTCSRYDGHSDPAGLWQPHAPGRLTARARLCGCHRTVQ
ncbi:glycerophosphoryl diester phosphodiesterase [Komagataeibacter xylinus NBRC 13693]|uniref:glycerophosphodiester phosphodiesterase n=1 Tax=Komagataeibacter xylinus NBRC 13693 TaxID=1234668 RepID=A0A0D6QD36_KOMXY|nr:glycerophosphoryl diester phosphodiesterase [Komagataeibacter xylinus NBRC 13693]